MSIRIGDYLEKDHVFSEDSLKRALKYFKGDNNMIRINITFFDEEDNPVRNDELFVNRELDKNTLDAMLDDVSKYRYSYTWEVKEGM